MVHSSGCSDVPVTKRNLLKLLLLTLEVKHTERFHDLNVTCLSSLLAKIVALFNATKHRHN